VQFGCRAEARDRDRNVVEDAEAFAVIGEGMMRSGEIHRDPVLDRVPCGLARSAAARYERSTSGSDHGNPRRRSSSGVSRPAVNRST
jgi:hypothetical protein